MNSAWIWNQTQASVQPLALQVLTVHLNPFPPSIEYACVSDIAFTLDLCMQQAPFPLVTWFLIFPLPGITSSYTVR